MDSQTHALPYVPLPSEHTMITKFEGSFIHVWKKFTYPEITTIYYFLWGSYLRSRQARQGRAGLAVGWRVYVTRPWCMGTTHHIHLYLEARASPTQAGELRLLAILFILPGDTEAGLCDSYWMILSVGCPIRLPI